MNEPESVETPSPVSSPSDGEKNREESTPQGRNRHPHSCGGCGAQWFALNAAHCSACHTTYASAGLFDRHRSPKGPHGTCLRPEDVGLEFRRGMWRGPEMSDEQKQQLYGEAS